MANKLISKIEGVKVIKKDQLIDERGKILHMLRSDDDNFTKFGEIYFSFVNPKKIKAWHYHEIMTLNYIAVWGEIKLVLYDNRPESNSKGVLQEFTLSKDNHYLISIPPQIWNGFCSNNSKEAVLANCSDIPHDKFEIKRIPFDDSSIPYNWR